MADRFAVGLDWNDSNSWATSSGGAGGAGIPTLADDAFIDSNSPIVTLSGNSECNNLTISSGRLNQNGFSITVTTLFTITDTFEVSSTNRLFVGSFSVGAASTIITKNVLNNLLTENGDFLLLETGDKIELEN